MDFSNIACWIWLPLIAGLICGILGYLLGRLFGSSTNKTIDYSADLEDCKRKTASLQADLDACTRKTASLEADLASSESKLSLAKKAPLAATSTASIASSFAAGAATSKTVIENTNTSEPSPSIGIIGVPFDAAVAKGAYGKKKVRENDLTIVEGIGPKISELFHNHDIKTWAALASTSVEKCQEVLNSGGKRYEIHRPGTWPMQAEMAALGKWAELKKWQDEHDYGKA